MIHKDPYINLLPRIPNELCVSPYLRYYEDVGNLYWSRQTNIETKFKDEINYFIYFKGFENIIYLPNDYFENKSRYTLIKEYRPSGGKNHFNYIRKLFENISRDEILNIPYLLPFLEQRATDMINEYVRELKKAEDEKRQMELEKQKKIIRDEKIVKLLKIRKLEEQLQHELSINGIATNCVYFIRSGDKIKIGKAKDFNKRLSSIKTSNPDIIIVGLKLCGDQYDCYEKKIHDMFENYRLVGEWFENNLEIMNYISKEMIHVEKKLCDIYNVKLEKQKYNEIQITMKDAICEYYKRNNTNGNKSCITILKESILKEINEYNKCYGKYNSFYSSYDWDKNTLI